LKETEWAELDWDRLVQNVPLLEQWEHRQKWEVRLLQELKEIAKNLDAEFDSRKLEERTSLPDWSNLDVLHRNTLPPRAAFFVYDNAEDALTRDVSRSKTISLSGTYSFHLAGSPFEAPDFFDPGFDRSSWGFIEVPGMWQLQGYGKGPQ
jgi:hypothetical protein